jgi:hypothetical protein
VEPPRLCLERIRESFVRDVVGLWAKVGKFLVERVCSIETDTCALLRAPFRHDEALAGLERQ